MKLKSKMSYTEKIALRNMDKVLERELQLDVLKLKVESMNDESFRI